MGSLCGAMDCGMGSASPALQQTPAWWHRGGGEWGGDPCCRAMGTLRSDIFPFLALSPGAETDQDPHSANHLSFNTIFSTPCTDVSLLALWLDAEPCCALMVRHLRAVQLMLRRCWFPRVPAAVRDPTPEGCSHAHSTPQPSTVHPRHRSACIARLCTGT